MLDDLTHDLRGEQLLECLEWHASMVRKVTRASIKAWRRSVGLSVGRD